MTETLPAETAPAEAKPLAFTFGDVEGVLDRRELLLHIECGWNGRWYEPPVPLKGLARLLRVSAHHSSAIMVKRNLLVKHFKPSRLLNRTEFGKWVLDYLVMANGYLEAVPSMSGRPMELRHSLSLCTRRGREDGQYWFLPQTRFMSWANAHEFAPGSVFHLLDPDVSQEIYGLPEYLSALQAGLLNESATLFRRKYYLNGAHAGFILYLSEANIDNKDVDALREQLRQSKGAGNFKNLFMHVPNGKKDGVQLLPVGEVAAKDEFLGIKNTTRDDILAAHRVPPQLLGVIPQNNGGFGDVGKANDIFFANEIEPLMMRLTELNDWIGEEAVTFEPYRPATVAPGAQPPA